VWHVSVSIQRIGVAFVIDPDRAEELAVASLVGVGGDVEWWLPTGDYKSAVAHLRVPTTAAEQRLIPAGLVTMDAGNTGPQRPRTR
jgi:hypothetical protein